MRVRPFSLCAVSLHVFLLFGTLYIYLATFPVSYAAVLKVPEQYATISAAIEAARAGDTIQVSRRSGESQSVYNERIVIDKQLMLVGESRDTIIIDGNSAGTVVSIQADGVQFKGFTVRNGGQQYSGIRANSYSYVVIANNTVRSCRYGVVLLNSVSNTVESNVFFNNSMAAISLSQSVSNNIRDNSVSESAYGIKLSSSNATFVVGNALSYNSYGVYIEHSYNDTVDKNTLLRNKVDGIMPTSSYDIIVRNNTVSESAYGIQLYQSTTVTVVRNTATNNSYGVYLAYSGPSNNIVNNTLSRNDWGITLYSSSTNTISGNTLSYNTYGVDPATDANNNLIYHNNFVDNAQQASWNPYCSNTWDNGYPSGGNYWSDYTGIDANKDGIGDTPYTIDPSNQDRYPLMNIWGAKPDIAIVSVSPSVFILYAGYSLTVTVTAKNLGMTTETFDVTAYYGSSAIGTQTITGLIPGASSTLLFAWSTTGVSPKNYTISASTSAVAGDVNPSNNSLNDGQVHVKIPGDINGDRVVDILDAGEISSHWYTPPAPPGPGGYDPDADINSDGKVDIFDAAVVNGNWLKTEGG